MVEYIASQDRCLLNIEANYYNQLDIEAFSQMMKDPSYCYKFYWLEAVVHIISEGKNETTFDEIIDEMIANAWYSVREFHIHLSGIQADGLVRDGLERAILQLTELSDLPANASKIEIKNAIREHQAGLKKAKEQLTNMVPYRALAGFFTRSNEVPGLIYKLAPRDEKMRKLSNVRKLWQGIMKVQEIRDIFTGQPVKETQYDVDHFIPWSFVMNDELWNLMPMDSSLNSAKSNRLPKWNPFFEVFAGNQYLMYEMINERPDLHKRFEACYRDNLHSIWAGQELYRKGNSREVFYNILERNMMPVYDSARRQGYEIWNYG